MESNTVIRRSEYRKPKFFLVQRNGAQAKSCQVILKYSIGNGVRLEYYTGLRIPVAHWDKANMRVRRNITGAAAINHVLNAMENRVQELVQQQKVYEKVLSLEVLRAELDKLKNPESESPQKEDGLQFFDAFQKYVENVGTLKGWAPGTYVKVNVIRKHLLEFEEYRKEKISLSEIDQMLLSSFISFLIKVKGLKNPTILKEVKQLKWFSNWCYQSGIIKEQKLSKVKVGLTGAELPKTKIILQEKELSRLVSMEFSEKERHLDLTRDLFVFSCMTGLRISDVKNLKWEDIKHNRIELTTKKTVDTLIIDIEEVAQALFEKYRQIPGKGRFIFPVPPEAVLNRHLKEIGKLLELFDEEVVVFFRGNQRHEEFYKRYELLTFHCARKTFISLALASGMLPHVVKSITGISTEQVFRGYTKITDDIRRTEMKKLSSYIKG